MFVVVGYFVAGVIPILGFLQKFTQRRDVLSEIGLNDRPGLIFRVD